MQVLLNFVVAIQMLAALIMIGLVLVQHGKGADMGASFGSGSSGSLFGATGSANFLSRSTAVCAAVFFVCTLTLAYFSHERASASPSSSSTILDRAPGIAASAPAGGASGAASGASAPADAASAVVVPAAPVQAASGAGAIPTK
ncbi:MULTISPECIES: preprotein translocase subunit SecG [unclassified Rhizobacter]|uniref:preprotein translocase subunit SecG n=1 Tax=unclassified Rhizobacter TaxID=2640088 RepID=UPI0006F71831|nr:MULTISPECIES: preprotein translocase subunit SecG [unclassified Rhizobacter]KQU64466.1 preprotein translocase subunit SecG [Rhizobacter sp. Root29]KQW11521.1 preprotein translocase subunit SecG [Rhizobacter sp. Root1238]KRB19777.1 preprotein translocase subunit SecG [Rhizobacter sp. Root16D2]